MRGSNLGRSSLPIQVNSSFCFFITTIAVAFIHKNNRLIKYFMLYYSMLQATSNPFRLNQRLKGV
jgi:hypothetical protein